MKFVSPKKWNHDNGQTTPNKSEGENESESDVIYSLFAEIAYRTQLKRRCFTSLSYSFDVAGKLES